MRFPQTIETERLRLRPWREDDAEACFRCASDPRVGLMCGWQPHRSAEESLAIIRTILSAQGTYAVTIRETDEAIGSVSLQPACSPALIGSPELGYWLGVPYWGNGYMPEACAALLAAGFALDFPEIWVSHFAENHQSRRVIKKLGFVYRFREPVWMPGLGEERELWYYSKKSEAWSAERSDVSASIPSER